MSRQQDILDRIKEIVHAIDPEAKVYLYGSRARGSARPDSDWDLLVLVDRDTIPADLERSLTYSLYDLEFEIGEVISPMVYAEKEWNSKYRITPYYSNVMREARML